MTDDVDADYGRDVPPAERAADAGSAETDAEINANTDTTMNEIVIVTTEGTFAVRAGKWARGSDGDIHLYHADEHDGDSVATIEGARFVAAVSKADLTGHDLVDPRKLTEP